MEEKFTTEQSESRIAIIEMQGIRNRLYDVEVDLGKTKATVFSLEVIIFFGLILPTLFNIVSYILERTVQ